METVAFTQMKDGTKAEYEMLTSWKLISQRSFLTGSSNACGIWNTL